MPHHHTDGEDQGAQVEIRVRGHLDRRWAGWFDGLAISPEDDGTTRLHGPAVDQAGLHGALQTLRDLGLDLVSVSTVLGAAPDDPTRAERPDHRSEPT